MIKGIKMKHKTQLIFIHGGMTFKNKKDYLSYLRNREISIEKKKKWSEFYLDKKLGRRVEIIRPRMPSSDSAQYDEWKIHFERYIPYLKDKVILVGESLGAIFLAKYLSENKFPKKILSTYLICAPYDNTLPEEDLVGGFTLKSNLAMIEKNSKNLYLLFSADDNVVPISHAIKYQKKLAKAEIIIYKSKNGHFKISKFPEIVKMIKSNIRENLKA